MSIRSVNPYTEKVLATYKLESLKQVETKIKGSKKTFNSWRRLTVKQRANHVKDLVKVLKENKEKYAKLMTEETGKVYSESISEIDKCIWLCEYYVKKSPKYLKDRQVPALQYKKSYVKLEPLGVILGIMPWNYPFWLVLRFAIPTILAGNVVALKHSSTVPQTALSIEGLFRKAGFPKNVFSTLMINSRISDEMIKRDLVQGVSLTGSVEAGSQIGAIAGKNIKRTVMELGGSDAFIVLEDANVKKAAKAAIKSRFRNSGQSCNAAKRFIVMRSVAKEFEEEMINELLKKKIGDPMHKETDLGPLANSQCQLHLELLVRDAKKKGANIHYGQEVPKGKGHFFRPAVLTNVDNNMLIVQDECFGPLAPIIRAGSVKEIIEITNHSKYGLGAMIWTKNGKKALDISKELDVGTVAINGIVRSDPRLPFGGVKKSGLGRELSEEGIKEFVNVKTIIIGGRK